MKVIKENLWNRIFRKKEILAQQEEKCRRQHLLDVADGLIHDVENGKTLTEMVTLHKRIWSEGFRTNGEASSTFFIGTSFGSNFKEACNNFAIKDANFKKYYSSNDLTYWGL